VATRRLEKLSSRRTSPYLTTADINEVYKKIVDDEAIKYAIGSMQDIDPIYTKNTFEEGNRVLNQLDRRLNNDENLVEFCFQGSVTSDTHIKAYSDIDLVTLHNKFYSLEDPLKPTTPYKGNPLEDLKELRNRCTKELELAFPEAILDKSKSKALGLSGGSLKRKIDIVIGNWWTTLDYDKTNIDYYRGIKLLDLHKDQRISNKPFLHNKLLDVQDKKLSGNLRKVIRLLKSLKYDADNEVNVSSFDIASIAYRMPDNLLNVEKGQELLLVKNTETYLRYLIDNEAVRNELMVINNMRKIFGSGNTSLKGLQELHSEILDLVNDVQQGLNRSFRKLAEARIAY